MSSPLVMIDSPVSILAEFKQGRETVSAEHHPDDNHGAMKYVVRIIGGICHGTEIHCRTEQSVLWLFRLVVAARKDNRDWNWLKRADRR
jgi:hypothetical protein